MTVTDPIRLLVVDDHSAMRKSLVRLFAQCEDMEVAAEAADGSRVIDLVRDGAIDVVLLDVSMPGKNGMEVLQELKEALPAIPVLMLSIHAPERYRAKALELGAAEYISKDRANDDLIPAVRRISTGD